MALLTTGCNFLKMYIPISVSDLLSVSCLAAFITHRAANDLLDLANSSSQGDHNRYGASSQVLAEETT